MHKFRKFGKNDGLAVRRLAMLGKVVLVLVFSGVKRRDGTDFCDDGMRCILFECGDISVCASGLRRGVCEDHGAILGADVVALLIERAGVVNAEENFEQVWVSDLLRIETNLHDFGMLGVPRADVRVTWIGEVAAAIAGCDAEDAAHLLKNGF